MFFWGKVQEWRRGENVRKLGLTALTRRVWGQALRVYTSQGYIGCRIGDVLSLNEALKP